MLSFLLVFFMGRNKRQNVVSLVLFVLYIQVWGNCNLPTCGLACFNNAHLWFKSCHLTHLRWAPLDPRYPPLPFLLENLIYYISQHQNTIRILETGLNSLPLSTFKPSKIPKPISAISRSLKNPKPISLCTPTTKVKSEHVFFKLLLGF